MDTTQFGGDREHRERLVSTSTAAFDGVRTCRQADRRRGQRPGDRGRLRAVAALRPAGGLGDGALRLSGAAARDPAELRRRAGGAAGDGRPGPLPHRALVDAAEAQRLGIVREVTEDDVVARALELAQRIAGLPREAILETKRRTLLERSHLWGFLFEDEERVFRRALLGG